MIKSNVVLCWELQMSGGLEPDFPRLPTDHETQRSDAEKKAEPTLDNRLKQVRFQEPMETEASSTNPPLSSRSIKLMSTTANISESLQKLAALNTLEKENRVHIRVSQEKDQFQVVITSETKGLLHKLWQKLADLFRPSHVDDFEGLRKIFSTLQADFQQLHDYGNAEEKSQFLAQYREITRQALEGLQHLYEAYRYDDSVEGRIYRNDILEALSIAYESNRGLNELLGLQIQRISADPIKNVGKAIASSKIPLFRSADLEQVNEIWQRKFKDRTSTNPITIEEIVKDPELGKLLVIEDVKLGRGMDFIFAHHKLGRVLNNRLVGWILTSIMERARQDLSPGPKRTAIIVDFFKNYHISLATAYKGELYSYSETHGHSVRDEKSKDEAFQRPISDFAREIFMKDAVAEEQKVKKEIGPTGAVVTSNSFCRLRIKLLGEGDAATKFQITGKLLSSDEKNEAAIEEEESYAGKYLFSIKNMFGIEDGATTQFKEKKSDKGEGHPIGTPKKAVYAEHFYRCLLTNLVNRNKMMMVVQRLAPGDIHHYIEPVGGRVLSLKDSCEKLKVLMKNSASEAEKKQLEILIKNFSSDGAFAATGAKGISHIRGSQMSVSTLATKYQTPLSQNDRKIVMVEHADGSIAIHTFIGATVVNKVGVDAEVGEEYEKGQDRGKMGFGHEFLRKLWPTALKKNEEIPVRPAGAQTKLGEAAEKEELGGSTVVSLYFSKDFKPIDAMRDAVTYKDKRGEEREIEVECAMGDVIGYPSAYYAMQYVSAHYDQEGKKRDAVIAELQKQNKSKEEIIEIILNDLSVKDITKKGTNFNDVREQLMKAYKNPDNCSEEDKILLEGLKNNLREHIERNTPIRQEKSRKWNQISPNTRK